MKVTRSKTILIKISKNIKDLNVYFWQKCEERLFPHTESGNVKKSFWKTT